VRSEGRLAAESHALGLGLAWLGVGPAARGAFENAPAFVLRRDAQHGKHDLGKIQGRIDNRLGKLTEACAGALHVAGGGITREAVNCGSDDDIAGREGVHQLLKLWPVGGRWSFR
jgi:hypothetical protein